MRLKGEAIRGCIIKVVTLEAKVSHDSKAMVLSVGTLYTNFINISVSLVHPFLSQFILIRGVSLATVITLLKEWLALKRFIF